MNCEVGGETKILDIAKVLSSNESNKAIQGGKAPYQFEKWRLRKRSSNGRPLKL